MTQRDLALKATVAQSQIARIERGTNVPRVDTLDHLLEACGEGLYARTVIGRGLDPSPIVELRGVSPTERARAAEDSAPYEIRRFRDKEAAARWRPTLVLETLVRHEVRFVVIGGLAGTLHGSHTFTTDTDICFDRAKDNLDRLALALADLHAYPRGWPEGLPFVLDGKNLFNQETWTLDTDAGWFDCLAAPAGVAGFEQLNRNAVEYQVGDVTVHVSSVSDLIRMKLAAGRPKDLIEAEVLGSLQSVLDEEERGEHPE